MSGVKSVELNLEGLSELALVDNDTVWLVVPLRWWDFSTLLWWLLCPVDKKGTVRLTLFDGTTVSVKAVRIATKHIRIKLK